MDSAGLSLPTHVQKTSKFKTTKLVGITFCASVS